MSQTNPSNTLLLLPGLVCDERTYAAQIDAFGTAYRCHVPNYGSIDTLPAMAEFVLATAPSEKFAVAAHSMGGRVALEMVRQAPHRVQRLALMDTGYKAIEPGEKAEKEKAGRFALLDIARAKGMRAMADVWARGMVHPSRVDTPLFEEVLDMLDRSTPDVFAAQIHALINRPDGTDVLRALRCPTLILVGRQDNWSPVAQHEEIAALVPHANLVVVEDSGHMVTMEEPEAVDAALREWLGRPAGDRP
jgi:pimeloyl-ACP methyl ester carboxylesterase